MRAVIFASASGLTSGASAQRQNGSPSRHYVQFDRNHSGALPRRWRDHCPGNRRGWHVEVIYLAWPASEFPCSRVAGRFAGGPGGERPARGRRTAGPARTGLSRTGPPGEPPGKPECRRGALCWPAPIRSRFGLVVGISSAHSRFPCVSHLLHYPGGLLVLPANSLAPGLDHHRPSG